MTRPQPGESSTRQRVLDDISEFGPITIAGLVTRLGLTETAVRRHVDTLHGEGLIEVHEPGPRPRRRGRPAKAWVVSARGHATLPSGYDALARDSLRFLAEQAGRPAVAEFARRRAHGLVERCAPELPASTAPVEERARALVEALNDEGFAATTRPMGRAGLPGIQLCQGHCPVHEVAAEFPEICDAEAEAFSELLGVHVQRLATLAQGDHVCTTFIPTASVRTASIPPSTTTTERSTT